MTALTRAAIRSMLLGWAFTAARLAIPGQGWMTAVCWVLFSNAAWLLLLDGAFDWHDLRARRAAQRAELAGCSQMIASLRVAQGDAHFHEVTAGRLSGYLLGTGYVEAPPMGSHVIAVPQGQRCGICEAMSGWRGPGSEFTRAAVEGEIVRGPGGLHLHELPAFTAAGVRFGPAVHQGRDGDCEICAVREAYRDYGAY